LKPIQARLDDSQFDKLQQLFAFYGVEGENDSEKVRLFIDALYEKLLLYRKSQQASNQSGEQSPTTEELTCEIRIKEKETYYCVNHPPKMVKLETLQICRICKALFYDLGTKTLAKTETVQNEPVKVGETEPKEEPKQDPHAWRRDPNKHMDRYGMVFCEHDGGLWAYPSKCHDCKTPCQKAPDTNTHLSQTERLRRAQDSQPSQT
jgi:hypothetical protein